MAVIQPRSPDFSGYFQQINQGLAQRAEIERNRPSDNPLNMVAAAAKPFLERALNGQIDKLISDQGKVTFKKADADEFIKTNGLEDSPVAQRLRSSMVGKKFDPEKLNNALKEVQEEVRAELAKTEFGKMLPQGEKGDMQRAALNLPGGPEQAVKSAFETPEVQRETLTDYQKLLLQSQLKREEQALSDERGAARDAQKRQEMLDIDTLKQYQAASAKTTSKGEALPVSPEIEQRAIASAKRLGLPVEQRISLADRGMMAELFNKGVGPEEKEKFAGLERDLNDANIAINKGLITPEEATKRLEAAYKRRFQLEAPRIGL